MKILVIEDNKDLASMMGKYFRIKNIDCTVSNDGRDGLNKILEQKYDIILLDLAMPEFSGYDIVKSLEQQGKLKEEKIIVLTASSITDSEMDDLVKRGVRFCLKKPVRLDDLLDTMHSIA